MTSSHTTRRGAAGLRRISVALLAGLLAPGPVTIGRAESAPIAAKTAAELTTWAMRWITEVMAGRTERSQYAPAFGPQVTTEAIARMAHDLNAYGAAPLRAEIVQTKEDGDQAFAVVKFVFPRGDATSLLFGFDAAGKVTGIAVGGMAGD